MTWQCVPFRCIALIVAVWVTVVFPAPHSTAATAAPEGVWLIDGRVAVQIFDCSDLLCGRILWLQIPRDLQGELDQDKKNPDPALRKRKLCGLLILWGLHSTQPNEWGGGWFYNPDDGKTYNIAAKLTSANVIAARIYEGYWLFGKTKILHRVPHGTSNGWC